MIYTFDQIYSFSKLYGIRKLTHQVLYTNIQPTLLAMSDLPHIWSISNNWKGYRIILAQGIWPSIIIASIKSIKILIYQNRWFQAWSNEENKMETIDLLNNTLNNKNWELTNQSQTTLNKSSIFLLTTFVYKQILMKTNLFII